MVLMGDANRARLKLRLSRHYANQDESVSPEVMDGIVSAMLVEDARMKKAQPHAMGFIAFVAAQVRYIPKWTWAAQLLMVVLMFVMAHAVGIAESTKLLVGILSAATVLVGVPTVHASKLHGVVELEYSCPNSAASVMVARLLVMGCSYSLAVAAMVAVTATSLDVSVFQVALWACLPFFCSCAGSLAVLRKTDPSLATMLCAVWTGLCCALLVIAGSLFPEMYGAASLAVWAGAATVAFIWLVRELNCTVRAVALGLDAFSPQLT